MWFKKARLASDQQVVDLLRSMQLKLGTLESEQQKITQRFESLRGFVYSKVRKTHAAEESEEDGGSAAPAAAASGGRLPQGLSREELKRSLVATGRFVPGRPPRHD